LLFALVCFWFFSCGKKEKENYFLDLF